MTTGLNPEERRRIQEEEALRFEVKKREGFKILGKMFLIYVGVILFLLVCSVFFFFQTLSSIPGL